MTEVAKELHVGAAKAFSTRIAHKIDVVRMISDLVRGASTFPIQQLAHIERQATGSPSECGASLRIIQLRKRQTEDLQVSSWHYQWHTGPGSVSLAYKRD